ncbi:isochorismatase hydrolase [Proteiniborus sp. DW1]|uniref:isochorismatase family protein n=1 Tax=Proteiniborus sp. DW1 TaxID=1889883 RepID=UPI00092E09DF|nr:isochorismatase family cysteine hydrolase [Proteiniborus sp. DW1]SCG82891.1 isochorismatase hydrolase [Proteiniborus sp. DW1]
MTINNLSKVKKEDCALIIIDMQNDFLVEGAPIECPGGRELIPNISKMKEWAYANDVPVFYTKEMHNKKKTDFGMELERSEPEHCVEGTKGVEIIDSLAPTEKDYVIIKRRYSGFYLTDLDILMKGLDKKALILTGVATNVCVFATVLDAHQRDMRAIVLSDCVAGTSPDLHDAYLKNIDYVFGDVVTSEELISHFSK